MPLWYTSIHKEHHAVRGLAGLFDVSHMGRLIVNGRQAPAAVDRLTTNWASRLAVNQGQYSLLCHPSGGILDDLIVYRLGEEKFLLCVNAGNRRKDFRWIHDQIEGSAEVVDISFLEAQIAIQGPRAEEILQQLTPEDLAAIPYYGCRRGQIAGAEAIISRTGYTGEDGFELVVPTKYAERAWNQILAAGKVLGIQPVGLGSRDTLRLEMGYVLYGNDISQETTPLEAGLGWLVKWDKGEFIGRESLLRQKEEGLKRKLVGLEMKEGGILRRGYSLWSGDRKVGEVTSGNLSPSMGKSIGLGYVVVEQASTGTPLEVEIRNKRAWVEVVPFPFYSSRAKRKTSAMKRNEA